MSKNIVLAFTGSIVIAATVGWLHAVAAGIDSQGSASMVDTDACNGHPHVRDDELSSVSGRSRLQKIKDTPECRGKAFFFSGTLDNLGGNGRACSTCHVADDGFQLTPEHASARLRALRDAR